MNLVGIKFRAVFNGRKSHNGTPFSNEFSGEVLDTEGPATIYELMRRVAGYAEANNTEMEFVESAEISIAPYLESNDDTQTVL